MSKHVVVAGASGDLGKRIVRALVQDGSTVTALIRARCDSAKSNAVAALGARPSLVDFSNVAEIALACEGADCVVSAFAGLRDAMIDAQEAVLSAAVRAGVPRFIPSDFSIDYTGLPAGENLTFDLRREFGASLKSAQIASTAIFCGCFSEVLARNIPVLNRLKQTVSYWGDADHLMDFTTMDDTAAFTSAAARDSDAPSVLHIASFQASANDFVRFTARVLGTPFQLVNMGSVERLREDNARKSPSNSEGEAQLYSNWRKSQYLQSMFSTTHPKLDNTRYPEIAWTGIDQAVDLRQ